MAMAIAACISTIQSPLRLCTLHTFLACWHHTSLDRISPLRVLGGSLALEVVTCQGLMWCPAGPADKHSRDPGVWVVLAVQLGGN
jgi:hypothetical protein